MASNFTELLNDTKFQIQETPKFQSQLQRNVHTIKTLQHQREWPVRKGRSLGRLGGSVSEAAQVLISQIVSSSPMWDSGADSSEPGACFRFCLPLSLSLPCLCSVSLSLSKINIKGERKREITYKEIEMILTAEFLAVTVEAGRKENNASVCWEGPKKQNDISRK